MVKKKNNYSLYVFIIGVLVITCLSISLLIFQKDNFSYDNSLKGSLADINPLSSGSGNIIIPATDQTSSYSSTSGGPCFYPTNAPNFEVSGMSTWPNLDYSGVTFFDISSLTSNSFNKIEACYSTYVSNGHTTIGVLNEPGLVGPNNITEQRIQNEFISSKGFDDTTKIACFDITNFINTILSKGQKNLYISLATDSDSYWTFWGTNSSYKPYLNITNYGGSCTPTTTCITLGKQCGSATDNCGNTLNCGTCSGGQSCSNGQCVNIKCNQNIDCGTDTYIGSLFCQSNNMFQNYTTFLCNNPGTISSYCSNSTAGKLLRTCTGNNKCISGMCICVSQNCSQLGKQCGSVDDGCGNTISCGSCSSGLTCNSSGQCATACTSVCSSGQKRCNGSYTQTCADYNSDSCYEWGGDINCSNGCTSGICNSCTPTTTCSSLGKQCGSATDNCGNTLNCGTCSSGLVCNSTGQCVNIKCNQNLDCGTDGFIGNTFCQSGSVYQNYTTFTCNNPGTISSLCSNSTTNNLRQSCNSSQICSTGQCVPNSCTNICISSGLKRCNGNNLQTCGDYNSDGCLEWGGDYICTSGCNLTTLLCNGCTPTCSGKICGQSDGCGSVCNLPCNDNNKCTLDSCSVGGCQNVPIICPSGQSCDNNTGFCSVLCDGCTINSTCINRGIRITQNNISIFCGINNVVSNQKDDNLTCSNNYECLSNECNNGVCVGLIKEIRQQTSLLWQIWCWITNLFNSSAYSQCVSSHS